ncbi:MAG: hypothetical protein GY801_07475, partial [bacterium]|nr:hypothetical protein [bacterium]
LIEHGANINVRDSDGSTALKRALHRGAVDIVRMLIEHGAKIEDEIHTKNDNQAHLIKASIQNDVKSVRRLLAKGEIEDVDAPDECDKLTPLMYAALCGSTETIKMLLYYGADVNARGGWVMEYGIWIPGHGYMLSHRVEGVDTALTCAAHGDHVETVKVLLEHGADINTSGAGEAEALYRATSAEMVKVLFEHGANVSASAVEMVEVLKAHEGTDDSPANAANNSADVNAKDHEESSTVFMKPTALMKAARRGEVGAIKVLLAYGADVNAKIMRGDTALMWAVKADNAGIVNILLAHGADVNAKTNEGRTSLMWAIRRDNVKLVNILLAHGADVNAKMMTGDTALMWAVKPRNGGIVNLLLAHGADANAKDKGGRTALMWAVKPRNDNGTVNLLLAYGADVNAKDDEGMTALMWAINIGIVKVLLADGADVNAKDNEGMTALMRAAECHRVGSVKVLLTHGADVDTRDNDGQTALMRAESSSNTTKKRHKIVHLLQSS